jgi:uncharacterized protein (TIGR03083 family)
VREQVRQLRLAKRRMAVEPLPMDAALNAIQVEERAGRTPAELLAELEAVAPRAVRGRRRTPAPVRRFARISVEVPHPERWSMGYFVDVILTRDQWLHRCDIEAATGALLVLDAGHDGRIVADVVAEWARRHGQPFTLVLGGPAGGTYRSGQGGPTIELDAVDLCRTLSGRIRGEGLLATEVPF